MSMLQIPLESPSGKTGTPAVERIRSMLYRYCLALTGSPWEAEDLVQETCLRGLPVIKGAIAHPNPEAYLLRIARNVWVDEGRRKQRARLLAVSAESAGADGEEALNGVLAEDALRTLLAVLSPQQRAAFLLREVCGYSGAEAARLLNATEGSVKAALRRARASLDALRRSEEGEPFSGRLERDSLKEQLTAYLSAFRSGDMERIVRLVQEDVLDPVVGASLAVNARQGAVRMSVSEPVKRNGVSSFYCLAA